MNYRLNKDATEHYTSLEALRDAWGKDPVHKTTTDKKKLVEQQNEFLKNNHMERCECCGSKLKHIVGTNIFVCSNNECPGMTNDGMNNTIPYTRTLNTDKGMEIAINLFD